ncbi:receptor-like protein eix2 [Quercus suber]|uniref:Receptor-like protein eix2 n=1 Tax=Quercus suber TaxID=58331 RepID=A0AAW0IIR8_QUESU
MLPDSLFVKGPIFGVKLEHRVLLVCDHGNSLSEGAKIEENSKIPLMLEYCHLNCCSPNSRPSRVPIHQTIRQNHGISPESIDFSLNQLSGQVPSSMSSLTFLNHLNLSNNNLIGKIPLSTQLQSLDPSSFIGNKLCGPPLTNNCATNGVKPNIRSKDTSGLEVDWFYVSMSLGFVVGFGGVCGPLLYNKQWRMMYFQFLDHIGYKLKSVVL